MPSYRAYSGTTQSVQIEVEGLDASSASYADALSNTVVTVAQQVAVGLKTLNEKERPQRMQIGFGLRALSSGGYAIAQAADNVNFRVTLTWNEREKSDADALTDLVPRPR